MPTTAPSEGYYKARKSYLLTAAVLGVWELIGVTLEKLPIEDVELSVVVRSPEAVPYALIVLLAYLAYRFSVEWHYCADDTRRSRLSRADFSMAHALAVASVVLFSYQSSSGVLVGRQLVEIGVPSSLWLIMGSAFAGIIISLRIANANIKNNRRRRVLLATLSAAPLALGWVLEWLFFFLPFLMVTIGFSIGVLIVVAVRGYSWLNDAWRMNFS